MGLYHFVGIAYGIEIPADTDIDEVDRVLQDQPKDPDNVGYIVVGDMDQLLLVTRYTNAEENTVVRLTPDTLAEPADLPGGRRPCTRSQSASATRATLRPPGC